MKILIDGRSITPKISGIGRYTDELIKGYIKYYGFNSVFVILNNEIEFFPYQFILCPYNRHSLAGTLNFSFYLAKQDYNIYHSADTIGTFWHRKKSKHLITVHDLMFLTVPNFFGKETLKIKLRIHKNKLLFGLILKDADQIISISQKTRDDIYKYYKKESFILREGVNKLTIKKEVKQIADLKKNSFFLYVGIGAPHKNISFLINAFLSSKTNKKLVVCGKEHFPIESDRILYTGWIEDSELSYLYSNCAAFIFPSLYEGFGLPILEALSYHCKVFTSNAGALAEFSNEIVYFFDPYNINELVALIEKSDDIQIDNKKIDEYLNHFKWDKIWFEFHKKQSVTKYDF